MYIIYLLESEENTCNEQTFWNWHIDIEVNTQEETQFLNIQRPHITWN